MGDQEAAPDVLMIPDHNATCTVTNTPPFMRGFAPPPTLVDAQQFAAAVALAPYVHPKLNAVMVRDMTDAAPPPPPMLSVAMARKPPPR
jgi:hypothetical protein